MLGLNVESIVSFPHNTFQTGEYVVIGAIIPVTASWIHCPHTPNNLLPSLCCFKLKMYQNRFRRWGAYDAPRPLIGWGRGPPPHYLSS